MEYSPTCLVTGWEAAVILGNRELTATGRERAGALPRDHWPHSVATSKDLKGREQHQQHAHILATYSSPSILSSLTPRLLLPQTCPSFTSRPLSPLCNDEQGLTRIEIHPAIRLALSLGGGVQRPYPVSTAGLKSGGEPPSRGFPEASLDERYLKILRTRIDA